MTDKKHEARDGACKAPSFQPGDLGSSLQGRYLTFKLSGELYGLPILKVQEIITLMKITRIPKTPDFVLGCVNLRGRVVPVVDLRLKFGFKPSSCTDRTCIVVAQIPIQSRVVTLGAMVDEVCEVLNLDASLIAPPPSLGSAIDSSFILGVGKTGENVTMLLDLDKVFSESELAVVGRAAA